MNEHIKVANKLYAEKKWEAARKEYIKVIDKYLYEVPLGTILKLAIVQRFLEHYESSEKTLFLAFEKYPNHVNIWIEYAALENKRKNWEKASEFWEKSKSLSKKFSVLNYQRYTHALEQFCLSRSKNMTDKINEKECSKIKELIAEAFSLYGEDSSLKKRLDALDTTKQSKKK